MISTTALTQYLAAIIFALALLHTFSAKQLERLAHRYPSHAGVFHLLGEVEIVFGLWAIVFVLAMTAVQGGASALSYAESRNFVEPLFVFVIMVMAASRPILHLVAAIVGALARLCPFDTRLARVWLAMSVIPLLGSLITEPAAMTLAALTLAPVVFQSTIPERAKYMALGALFVNVSIGGTLTSYAAPPVLMVATTWEWNSMFMLTHFGWKATLAVLINATAVTLLLRKPLAAVDRTLDPASGRVEIPLPIVAMHVVLLGAVVALAHHPVAFIGVFLLFLGFTQAYDRFQSPLIIKEALLVGFFLAGLVVLGGMQQWWLQPIVSNLQPLALFFGALGLTAITDNAALTYLGSLIQGISEDAKYMLVAGAVAGGGLTVIANAPNPAGVALLKAGFSNESIGALGLLLGALMPTAVAALLLLLL